MNRLICLICLTVAVAIGLLARDVSAAPPTTLNYQGALTNTSGTPVSATIIDFKTDRVGSADEIEATAEKYRPQLETYREVLQRMTGMPANSIRCCLIFTRRQSLKWL